MSLFWSLRAVRGKRRERLSARWRNSDWQRPSALGSPHRTVHRGRAVPGHRGDILILGQAPFLWKPPPPFSGACHHARRGLCRFRCPLLSGRLRWEPEGESISRGNGEELPKAAEIPGMLLTHSKTCLILWETGARIPRPQAHSELLASPWCLAGTNQQG